MLSKKFQWVIIFLFLLLNLALSLTLSYNFNIRSLLSLLILNLFLYILLKKLAFKNLKIIIIISISIFITVISCIVNIYVIHVNAYRLGDLILYHNINNHPAINILKNKVLEKYPKSIGAAYVRKTNKHSNFSVLNNIIKNVEKNIMINDTREKLAVHLRLGDVLLVKKPLININKGGKDTPEYIVNYLNKYFKNIPKIIYYGDHTIMGVKETKDFIDKIRTKIPNCEIVEPSSSYSVADQHLCEMINAKQFIRSGNGGYATLIKNIRKIRGKKSLFLK